MQRFTAITDHFPAIFTILLPVLMANHSKRVSRFLGAFLMLTMQEKKNKGVRNPFPSLTGLHVAVSLVPDGV
jgi:hypothetical protein